MRRLPGAGYAVVGTRFVANPRGHALNRSSAQTPQQLAWKTASLILAWS
ncbi:MAG: hypothetical protein ACM3WS_00605 [Bacillota bacterium]